MTRDESSPFAGALFTLALVPRAIAAFALRSEPVWDGHYYDFGARRIAQGLGYSDDLTIAGRLVWHPWCHYPVGYSAVLAVFYRILGPGPHAAAILNSLTGAALALVTWALARHGLSERRARIAGLLVALHPGLVLYSALVMTEPLAALLTLTGFWLAVRDHRPKRGLAIGALVLGLAALVRPQALLCAPFLALVLGVRASSIKAWVRLAAGALAASAIALVVVLPWTLRNCRVMDGCALVSTNAGWNLAIGAFPRATGRFETLHASDGCREVTGQVQQDRCWFDYGLAQIRADPARWLSLIPAKLGFTFDHEAFAVEYLREARPEAWPERRRTAWRGFTTFVERLLVCAAALGVVALVVRPRGPEWSKAAAQGGLLCLVALLVVVGSTEPPAYWPLAVLSAIVPWLPLPGRPRWSPALLLGVALLATTILTHAVFFGEDRYHVVVVPVLCTLAAGALRPSAQKQNAALPEPGGRGRAAFRVS